MNCKKIGICSQTEMKKFNKLTSLLEQIYPIQFEIREFGHFENLNAAIVLDANEEIVGPLLNSNLSCFVVLNKFSEKKVTSSKQVTFGNDSLLHPSLHKRNFTYDPKAQYAQPIETQSNDIVMAFNDEGPIWVVRLKNPLFCITTIPLEEVGENDCLRDYLWEENYLSLLPFLEFLRELTKDNSWQPPSLRACINIDDPNLHFSSYGYIKFQDLANKGYEHNFHAAIATIPIDCWHAKLSVIKLFQENRKVLSLAIHGNNHIKRELFQHKEEIDYERMCAQIVKRINRFEAKYKIDVSRVMIPPQEKCSKEVIDYLLQFGFEGILASRADPWNEIPFPPHGPPEWPLADWYPAEWVGEGIPLITRRSLGDPKDRIVLLSYLNKPIVFTTHQKDYRSYNEIIELADFINSLGSVQWMSMKDIFRSNYFTRQEDNVLFIKLYSRKIHLDIPEGVDFLVVEIPTASNNFENEEILVGGNQRAKIHQSKSGGITKPIPISTAGSVNLQYILNYKPQFDTMSKYQFEFYPYLRRLFTIARDQLSPLLKK